MAGPALAAEPPPQTTRVLRQPTRPRPGTQGNGHLWRIIEVSDGHARDLEEAVARLGGGRLHRLLVAARIRRPHPYMALLVEDLAWTRAQTAALRLKAMEPRRLS